MTRILASTIMFTVAARAATPDATLIFFVTCSIAVYVGATPRFAARGEQLMTSSGRDLFPTDWRAVLAMYALMGFAALAKGPVGFVLPTAVIGTFLLITRPSNGRADATWP